jgi:hypothetical protein
MIEIGQGINTAAIFIVLKANERPDAIDAQFFKTIDESLALTHAKTNLRLDKKRLFILWNKADEGDTLSDVAEFCQKCYEKFDIKWLPSVGELLDSNQILIMPKMTLGGGRHSSIETVPDKANALVHQMYDLIFPKLRSVATESSPAVPLQ